MDPIEQRSFLADVLRFEEQENAKGRIRGHAAVFNSLSEPLNAGNGQFRERIMPGAFADALQRDDVRALINHKGELILGRMQAGTLRVHEDGVGLAVEIDPPETQYARDLVESIRRGDITQMSFGFSVTKEGQAWERGSDGVAVRTIKSVSRLLDVSVVTFPAYPQTDVAVRSLEEFQRAEAEAVTGCRTRLRMRLALAGRGVTA